MVTWPGLAEDASQQVEAPLALDLHSTDPTVGEDDGVEVGPGQESLVDS